MSSDNSHPRRWTATITYADNPLGLSSAHYTDKPDGYSETVDADLSENDLQRAQAMAAYSEAAQSLLAGIGEVAEVQLYKTTKAHGTRKDHVNYTINKRDAVAWALRQIVSTK
jgi:hypothetical protein